MIIPAHALAADHEGTVEAPAPTSTTTAWLGVSMGFIVTPMRPYRTAPTPRLDAGRMRACGKAGIDQSCSPVRGADIRFQFFSTRDDGALVSLGRRYGDVRR